MNFHSLWRFYQICLPRLLAFFSFAWIVGIQLPAVLADLRGVLILGAACGSYQTH